MSTFITEKENKLLQKIGLPFTKNLRFNLLITKRDTELLTKERRFKNPAKEGRIIVFCSLS